MTVVALDELVSHTMNAIENKYVRVRKEGKGYSSCHERLWVGQHVHTTVRSSNPLLLGGLCNSDNSV